MTAIVPFPSAPTFPPANDPSHEARSLQGWAGSTLAAADRDVAFRQLRHHTKNALQRILCHISMYAGLADTPEGRTLARDVERRVHLIAAVSDGLFGLTRAPDSLAPRLQSLGRAVVELLCDPGQLITLEVAIDGACPAGLEETVVRVAHELIGNAVKHGMHVRLIGRIDVTVRSSGRMTLLTVSDDGWGYGDQAAPGEGLSIARLLAESHGGTVQMRRDRDTTHVTLTLPHDPGRSVSRPLLV